MLSFCLALLLKDDNIGMTEQFVISVYDTMLETSTFNVAQHDIFKYKGDLEIRSVSPKRNALVLHIHRAAYDPAWI